MQFPFIFIRAVTGSDVHTYVGEVPTKLALVANVNVIAKSIPTTVFGRASPYVVIGLAIDDHHLANYNSYLTRPAMPIAMPGES
jgi:hypothetical protein